MLVVPELLVVENFQSLRDRTEIPLRPITLLYGPNSAGKSAVLDALAMFRHVLLGTEEDIRAHARRWCHQPQAAPGPGHAMRLRFEMMVGTDISHDFSAAILGLVSQLPSAVEECDDCGILNDKLCHRVAVDLTVPSDDPDQIALTIDVDARQALTVRWEETRVSHLAGLSPAVFGKALLVLADAYDVDGAHPAAFQVESWVRLHPYRLERGSALDADWLDYENLLLKFANFLIARVAELLPAPAVVAADRGVIGDNDLTFTGCSGTVEGGLGMAHLGLPGEFTSAPQNDNRAPFAHAPLLGQLALGWLHSRAKELVKARPWPTEAKTAGTPGFDLSALVEVGRALAASAGRIATGPNPLHDYVNDCLTRHLFLDQGYVLRYDLCEIRPAAGSPAAGTVWSDRWAHDEAVGGDLRLAGIVNIWLADSQGRALRFADVGSGLSCVLPVLGALWGGFSFIQQPELHLHPALQGALADVVVETAQRGESLPEPGQPTSSVEHWGPNCHILETHSEFLLLRCMRRLRQTAGGRQPDLRLSPEQVAVLYFDPQPDGSTRVKRIRLTPDGEFVDRWPRGFFEERARDLFDE